MVFRLSDELKGFIMGQDVEGYEEIERDLPALPEHIKVKHAAGVWRCIWKRYTTPVGL